MHAFKDCLVYDISAYFATSYKVVGYHYLAGCRQLNYKCKSNHIRAEALPKLLQLDWWLKMTVGRGPSYLLSPPNCQHFPSSIPPPALHSPLHFTTPRLALSFIDIEGPLPTLC